MKVLVLNPPNPDKHYINRDQMGGMGQRISFGKTLRSKLLSMLKSNFIHLPVMDLVYIATILSKNHNVKVIDAPNENKTLEGIKKDIESFNPDYAFMSVSSSGILFERDSVAKYIKEINKDCKIITVGETITHLPNLLKEPFDIAIKSEPELIVNDICDEVDLKKIKGIIYLDKSKLKFNPDLPLLEGVEQEKLPFPKWELFPYKEYTYYPLLFKTPVATLQSTRGCPYGCHYCSYPHNQGLRWRYRNAENVVQEMEEDYKKYKFKGIFMRDPLFTLDKKRIEDMCNKLIEKDIKLVWAVETRPELLNSPLLDKMYSAGCRAINMGVESVDIEVLKKVGRYPINQDKIKEVVNYAESIGIRTTCFFIFGLPGATKQNIQDTINFSLALNPSHADYKVATPFPGTKMYEAAKANNWIISEEYEKIGGYSSAMQVNPELTPDYLESKSSEAFSDFYFRGNYIFRELKRGSLLTKTKMMFKTFGRIAAQ